MVIAVDMMGKVRLFLEILSFFFTNLISKWGRNHCIMNEGFRKKEVFACELGLIRVFLM